MATARQLAERKAKAQHWQTHLDAWRQSGLPATKYCKQAGISVHQFKYWQYRLTPDSKRQQSQPKAYPESPQTSFKDITPILPQSQPSQIMSSPLILEIATRYRLHVRPNFDPETLKQLLNYLQEHLC